MNALRGIAMLAVFLLVSGCGPSGGSGGGGGGGSTFTANFLAPADGVTITAPFTLTVTGSDIARVRFKINTVIVADLVSSPFEHAVDPVAMGEGTYEFVITAFNSKGKEAKHKFTLFFDEARPSLTEIQAALDNLTPGEWYEIPDTDLDDVAWTGDNRGKISGIMESASGGAFDTSRDRLVVWGGGRGGYGGNEFYAFDLALAEWQRLNDPSPLWPGDPNNSAGLVQHPDGAPTTRHSYDAVAYIPPPIDRFIVCGGSAIFGGSTSSSGLSFWFDFDTLSWETLAATTAASNGAVSAVGPDGRVWHHGTSTANHLTVYDPVSGLWTKFDNSSGLAGTNATAEIDPVRSMFVIVGNGVTEAWSLTDPDKAGIVLPTTGAKEIEGVKAPGLVYHAGSDRIVAWGGGKDVYLLDLDTNVWTRVTGTGTVDPGPATDRGTLGRWGYSATRNLFVVVSHTFTNVFVYRLP